MTSVITTIRRGITSSAAVKVPVKVATTANITLSGEQTIDGVACTSNERVLVKDQTDGIENGIYAVNSGSWVREPDWDGTYDVKKGTYVYAANGTVGNNFWQVTTADTITVGTTSVAFQSTDPDSLLRTNLADTSTGQGASLVGIEDASSYWVGTDGESVLDEIGQHITSAQKFIPIGLHSLRETSSFDVGNAAAHGGVLASDTTPVLDAINAATDGCQRLLWASSNNDQVVFQTPLPPDLNTGADIVIHTRIVSGGTTNAVGFTVASFFNEADTSVADTSETNQTTTWAEKTTTIAAADIPSGAQTLTVGLTPVAHTTDTLAMSAVWLEYTGSLLTS